VEKGVVGVQDVTRPSALVVPLNLRVEEEEVVVVVEEEGLCKVRVTGMEDAGRPSVVSSTWHVIGGLGPDILGSRCDDRAEMRVLGDEEGMRGWWCAVELDGGGGISCSWGLVRVGVV